MKCREDRLAAWPAGEMSLPRERPFTFGTECVVRVYRSGREIPLVGEVNELAKGNREVQRDLARALGALVQFTRTPARQRSAVSGGWHFWKKENVRKQTGVAEPLLSFGVGSGTQVRIYAVGVDGQRHPTIAVLGAVYKHKSEGEGWSRIARVLRDLQAG